MGIDLLVEEELGVVAACFESFADPSYTVRVCLWALKEATVATENVVHAVLCCAVEFWQC
jgi:hypothetical protein